MPRPSWTQPEPILSLVENVYDKDATIAFQKMVGANPDGQHGGMTNSNIRAFLNQYGDIEFQINSYEPQDLLISLRKNLQNWWSLASLENDNIETLNQENCRRSDCVCNAIVEIKLSEKEKSILKNFNSEFKDPEENK